MYSCRGTATPCTRRRRLSTERAGAPASAPSDAVLAVDRQLVGHVGAILASPAPGQDVGRRRRRLCSLQLLQRRRIGCAQAERGRGRVHGLRRTVARRSLTTPKRGRRRALGRARDGGAACHQARACQEGQQARQRSAHRHCDRASLTFSGVPARASGAQERAGYLRSGLSNRGLLSGAVQNQAPGVISRVCSSQAAQALPGCPGACRAALACSCFIQHWQVSAP